MNSNPSYCTQCTLVRLYLAPLGKKKARCKTCFCWMGFQPCAIKLHALVHTIHFLRNFINQRFNTFSLSLGKLNASTRFLTNSWVNKLERHFYLQSRKIRKKASSLKTSSKTSKSYWCQPVTAHYGPILFCIFCVLIFLKKWSSSLAGNHWDTSATGWFAIKCSLHITLEVAAYKHLSNYLY